MLQNDMRPGATCRLETLVRRFLLFFIIPCLGIVLILLIIAPHLSLFFQAGSVGVQGMDHMLIQKNKHGQAILANGASIHIPQGETFTLDMDGDAAITPRDIGIICKKESTKACTWMQTWWGAKESGEMETPSIRQMVEKLDGGYMPILCTKGELHMDGRGDDYICIKDNHWLLINTRAETIRTFEEIERMLQR